MAKQGEETLRLMTRLMVNQSSQGGNIGSRVLSLA